MSLKYVNFLTPSLRGGRCPLSQLPFFGRRRLNERSDHPSTTTRNCRDSRVKNEEKETKDWTEKQAHYFRIDFCSINVAAVVLPSMYKKSKLYSAYSFNY